MGDFEVAAGAQALDDEAEGVAAEVELARKSKVDAEAILTRLQGSRDENELVIRLFLERAETLGIEGPPTHELILKESRRAEERVHELSELLSRTIAIERGLDAAAASARRAELQEEFLLITETKETIEERQARLKKNRRWLLQVRGALEGEKAGAVESHVTALGPLTTLLQRRLRPVYGFGDLRLEPKSDEIRVIVERAGRVLKPTNFFSDSQKQILMLSLFLAARLSQTWSGFSPILLDDPVTHFDDLNAFAFAEMLRGLISSSRHRQFFISTCEERLFDLMRSKLKGSEGGARFYRFESIGEKGPVIKLL